MGDFNAKVGRLTTQREPCIGQHGLGTRNERGQMLVDFATSINMVIQNACFKKKENSKWTWRSPNGEIYNEIDYFICSKNIITNTSEQLAKRGTKNNHQTKISQNTMKLIQKRNNMLHVSKTWTSRQRIEYSELSKTIKKKTRTEVRSFNTDMT